MKTKLKKMIDQNVEIGICEIPSGYTINAKPGPLTKHKNHHYLQCLKLQEYDNF